SLRMFNVYGTGQDLDNLDQGMVSIYLAYVVRGEPVFVKGPLDRVRDLVHVDDVVEAWKLALTMPVAGALNVGSGVGTRVDELLRRLFRACGVADDYPIVDGPRTPGDPYRSVADVTRARNELGWEARGNRGARRPRGRLPRARREAACDVARRRVPARRARGRAEPPPRRGAELAHEDRRQAVEGSHRRRRRRHRLARLLPLPPRP